MHQSGELTSYAGSAPAPVGGRDFLGPTALRRHYPCADGWIALACTEPGHFHQVGAALGHPEWAGRMTAEQAIVEPARGVLAELVAGALLEFPRAEAIDRLLARGVPAAPAYTLNELSEDAWGQANDFFRHYEHATFGTIRGVRRFAEWSRSASDYVRQCPEIGEHSMEVLADYGISEERIAALLADNVIKQG